LSNLRDDFFPKGWCAVVPEEGFVVEEADLVSGSSIILMDVGENPIKEISSCCFKKTWELIINVLIEAVASKDFSKG